MELKDKFKTARSCLRKSQKEMATVVGTAYSSWQKYEQGTSIPGGEVFRSLANLGFNINWFFDDDAPMNKSTQPQNGGEIDTGRLLTGEGQITSTEGQKGEQVMSSIKLLNDWALEQNEATRETLIIDLMAAIPDFAAWLKKRKGQNLQVGNSLELIGKIG